MQHHTRDDYTAMMIRCMFPEMCACGRCAQDMVRGGREAAVYELMFSDNLDEEQQAAVKKEDMVALRQFVPRFCECFADCVLLVKPLHSTRMVERRAGLSVLAPTDGIVEADGKKLLALDDSCHGYEKPCVLDAKVGKGLSTTRLVSRTHACMYLVSPGVGGGGGHALRERTLSVVVWKLAPTCRSTYRGQVHLAYCMQYTYIVAAAFACLVLPCRLVCRRRMTGLTRSTSPSAGAAASMWHVVLHTHDVHPRAWTWHAHGGMPARPCACPCKRVSAHACMHAGRRTLPAHRPPWATG